MSSSLLMYCSHPTTTARSHRESLFLHFVLLTLKTVQMRKHILHCCSQKEEAVRRPTLVQHGYWGERWPVMTMNQKLFKILKTSMRFQTGVLPLKLIPMRRLKVLLLCLVRKKFDVQSVINV